MVTDQESGVGIYHPGDLQEVFDVHRGLRGAVDVMLLPVPSTEGIVRSLVDAVRPSLVVPIHFRPAGDALRAPTGERRAVDLESGYPEPGVDTAAYRADLRDLIASDWFPSPADPGSRLDAIKRQVEELGIDFRELAPGASVVVGTPDQTVV